MTAFAHEISDWEFIIITMNYSIRHHNISNLHTIRCQRQGV